MLDLGIVARSRIRLVRQSEVSECGLACITMIANYHGLDIDIGAMRRRFAVSQRGVPLRALMNIADQVELTPRAVKVALESLDNLKLPAILHWDFSHYVVIERIKSGKALIHNPDGRTIWMAISEISGHYTGIALELQPSDNFEERSDRERLRLRYLWRRLTGIKRAIFQTIILSLVLQAYVLALPYYMQIAIDNALPAQDVDLLTVLALGFGLFTIINVGASMLRSYVLLVAGTSLGYGVANNIARRLFRLPVDWFEKRQVGDILSRFQSIAPIQRFLTEGAVAAVIDGSLAILTLLLMFIYNANLALIAVLAITLYGIVRYITFALQKSAQEAVIVEHGKEQSMLIETLRGITTLRMFGRETMRHAMWQTRLTDAVNADVQLARVGIWQETANKFIFGIENILTIWIAVSAVINGDGFSIGMVFAYIAYKTQFLEKSRSLMDQSIAFRMLSLHLERLSDIALTAEDAGFKEKIEAPATLGGSIELQNVRYRYSATDPYVLDDVNLKVTRGEHIAITGPSGGGKTTLAKIILALIEPEEGEVLIDDKPIAKFGRRNYQSQVSAVLQEDTLFSGTLNENIALFDDVPDREKVIKAAETAAIHDDIEKMPMQYETRIGEMGSTLSGGQKQRVLLARALYREPRLLVMDEGTAHLDSQYEARVNAAINALGISRIIIAHRRETIEAADRIVVMFEGQLHDYDPDLIG